MIYLLIANISLIISFVLYRFIFRNLTFFNWNRAYLIGSIVFALLIPIGLFIELPTKEIISYEIPTVYIEDMINLQVDYHPSTIISMADLIKYIYFTGLVVASISLMYRTYQLTKVLAIEQEYVSFSFFKKIVIGNRLKDIESISAHERIHVEHGHSYDLLFMELVRVFNWFNPILFFYQKELKFQHECIVDEACSSDKVAYAELLVAHAMQVDHLNLAHEFSNQSFLKKRIMMLFKNKSNNKHKLYYLSVVPIALVILGSTLVFNTSKAKSVVSKVEDKLTTTDVSSTAIVESLESIPTEILEQKQDDKIYESTEVLAVPSGGMKAYSKYIAEHVKYSKEMLEAKFNGNVRVSFVVEKDGSLTNVKALNDLGYGTSAEAIRVIKAGKKWKPAIQNGKAVRSRVVFPVKFVVVQFPKPKSDEGDPARITLKGSTNNSISDPDENVVFNEVEVPPVPPGGMAEFMKFIGSLYDYPKEATEKGVNGKIEVKFIVEKDGSLTDIQIIRDLGYGTGKAAIDVLKKSKKWKAGIQNGKTVRVEYTLPIRLNTLN